MKNELLLLHLLLSLVLLMLLSLVLLLVLVLVLLLELLLVLVPLLRRKGRGPDVVDGTDIASVIRSSERRLKWFGRSLISSSEGVRQVGGGGCGESYQQISRYCETKRGKNVREEGREGRDSSRGHEDKDGNVGWQRGMFYHVT
jgi:hypothetical protein